MYGPKPARNFSTSAGGNGAPPEEITWNEAKCSRVTSGWAASAMKAVDGPTVYAGRCSANASSTTPGWKRYARTRVPALVRQAASWHTMPVMWKSGASAKYEEPSATGCPVRWRSALTMMLPWEFMAPLGVPLVPEV